MPIYEFLCERCGRRFEDLVDPGVEAVGCDACGAEETQRVYSAHRPPFKIVKTAGEMRKQERRNSELRQRSRRRMSGRGGSRGGGE